MISKVSGGELPSVRVLLAVGSVPSMVGSASVCWGVCVPSAIWLEGDLLWCWLGSLSRMVVMQLCRVVKVDDWERTVSQSSLTWHWREATVVLRSSAGISMVGSPTAGPMGGGPAARIVGEKTLPVDVCGMCSLVIEAISRVAASVFLSCSVAARVVVGT